MLEQRIAELFKGAEAQYHAPKLGLKRPDPIELAIRKAKAANVQPIKKGELLKTSELLASKAFSAGFVGEGEKIGVWVAGAGPGIRARLMSQHQAIPGRGPQALFRPQLSGKSSLAPAMQKFDPTQGAPTGAPKATKLDTPGAAAATKMRAARIQKAKDLYAKYEQEGYKDPRKVNAVTKARDSTAVRSSAAEPPFEGASSPSTSSAAPKAIASAQPGALREFGRNVRSAFGRLSNRAAAYALRPSHQDVLRYKASRDRRRADAEAKRRAAEAAEEPTGVKA